MAGFVALIYFVGNMLEGYAPRYVPVQGPVSGIAKYYSPGIMAEVARNRGMVLREDVDGYASVLSCGEIGKVVVASINGGKRERYQVLDCSHPRDIAMHRRQGLIIEVDYQSAARNGFVRRGSARATIWQTLGR
jgi:hypothetical protein